MNEVDPVLSRSKCYRVQARVLAFTQVNIEIGSVLSRLKQYWVKSRALAFAL